MLSAPAREAALAAFRETVGPNYVLESPGERRPYETDWTRRFHGEALCVVRPANTAEVAAILSHCHERRLPVVPQGGNTGLVGGSVPRGGEVVLSLARLDDLEPVDTAAAQVVAGAGVTLEALRAHVAPAGFDFGVDMASRGSATVGGMVATNAGGIHVLRHGPMRSQVVGIEAILADGSIISRMSGVTKDAAGYDLLSLLAGSEGTLAVVTRVRLALVPRTESVAVALLGMESTRAALATVSTLRRSLPSLNATEVFFREGLDLVCAEAELQRPFAADPPLYLLVEAAANTDPMADLAAVLAECPGILDSAIAIDTNERRRLWAYRERHTEAINRAGVPHKLDVSVPLGVAAAFVEELPPTLKAAAPEARLILFGHLAEGNFHVNLLGLDPDDERADEAVLQLVSRYGGSISSEHGVGVAKARYLHLTRSPVEIDAMRAIKGALDARGILNPGVVLPPQEPA